MYWNILDLYTKYPINNNDDDLLYACASLS